MTPAAIGGKSNKTRAKELERAGLSFAEIGRVLELSEQAARELVYPPKPKRQQSISPASPEQRAKVKGKACIRCRRPGPCDPAHLISKAQATDDDGDPRRVVALRRDCHEAFDAGDKNGTGAIDLLPFLEPHFREEVAFAVEQVGLITALLRLSGNSWEPVTEVAA